MFRLFCTGLLLAALLVVVAACTAPGGKSWLALLSPLRDQATIELTVGTPIRLNQAVPITITVHANTDIRQMGVILQSDLPARIGGESHWQLGDVPAGGTLQLTSSVVFPAEQNYLLVAGVTSIEGMFYSTGHRIDFTAQGGVVMPPVTAQPGNLLGTPRPAPTSLPRGTPPTRSSPTPVPAVGLSPSHVAAGQVTLQGTVRFVGRTGSMLPLRDALVTIWDLDDPANGNPNDLLGTTYTDENGHWSIPPVSNLDA